MKVGWKTQILGELCRLISGQHIDAKDYNTESRGVGYLTGPSDFGLVNPVISKWTEHPKVKAKCGDILVTVKGSGVGKINLLDQDEVAISRQLMAVRTTGAHPRFIHAFLSSIFDHFQSLSTGAAIPGVSRDQILGLKIAVPAVPEQQRIVAILDEAFDCIAKARVNAEKNLQNARELFENHLQAVFCQSRAEWEVKRIKEIAKHSLGKMLDKAKNKGSLQPYLRNLNVRWFTFELSDLRQMPFLPEEVSKYTAIKGDVLICEGGYPGRAAIWDESYPIYFQKALHRVRFHEPEYNKWFLYYLYAQDKSGALKQHFNGAGIQHFTGEALARFELPLPPLPVIRKAIAMFEELSAETQRLESIYQQKIVALDELKKSLLHKAFAGEL